MHHLHTLPQKVGQDMASLPCITLHVSHRLPSVANYLSFGYWRILKYYLRLGLFSIPDPAWQFWCEQEGLVVGYGERI